MTMKVDYTTEEWRTLLQAVGAAGVYIIISDPNFVIGSMKEGLAVARSIFDKEKEENGDLLSALLPEFKDKEMAKQARLEYEKKDVATVKQTSLDALKDAAAILEQKASPEEAKEMKTWLYEVSVKTAEAAKEGGFLGFGGTRVSPEEEVALKEIAEVLGVTP